MDKDEFVRERVCEVDVTGVEAKLLDADVEDGAKGFVELHRAARGLEDGRVRSEPLLGGHELIVGGGRFGGFLLGGLAGGARFVGGGVGLAGPRFEVARPFSDEVLEVEAMLFELGVSGLDLFEHGVEAVVKGAQFVTALFFFILTPIGLLTRLFGKDILDQKIDRKKDSYWHEVENRLKTKGSYENQY